MGEEPVVHRLRIGVRRVERRLELLEVSREVRLAVEPARLLRRVEVFRARVDREAREDVFVGPRDLQEAERLLERLLGVAAIAEHHVVADFDPVLLRERGGLEDFGDGDLLLDRVEDALRAALHAERETLAAGEAHLAEQLVAEQVDARIAAPEELELLLADALAQLEDALLVRRERVVLDLDHFHGDARDDALDRLEDVLDRVRAEAPPPARLRAAERARPRAPARGHHDVRIEVGLRRRERVEVGHVLPLRGGDDGALRAVDGTGDPARVLAFLQAGNELEEHRIALAHADRVDRRVMREELRPERRRMRSADDDMRLRVLRLDEIRDEAHATSIRGPTRHAEHVGIDVGDDPLDVLPFVPGQIEHLGRMPRPDRLRADREEPVGRLVEIRVEITLAVPRRRSIRIAVRPDLPGRRINQRNSHASIVAAGNREP